MKNFITELYYGNVDPQASEFRKGSHLKKQMNILTDSEELLSKKLSGEDKKD